MPATPKTGIGPLALFAIRDLELRARVVVEGLWSDFTAGPLQGFSVEFTEYRQYSPGRRSPLPRLESSRSHGPGIHQDIRGRNQSAMPVLVDTSRSMGFASGEVSKSEYASTLAATLGYFLLQQRDVVGLDFSIPSCTAMCPPAGERGTFGDFSPPLLENRKEMRAI